MHFYWSGRYSYTVEGAEFGVMSPSCVGLEMEQAAVHDDNIAGEMDDMRQQNAQQPLAQEAEAADVQEAGQEEAGEICKAIFGFFVADTSHCLQACRSRYPAILQSTVRGREQATIS